jgi:hypothetical protein
MANETNTNAPKATAKGYKLAKGTAVELRGMQGIKIDNESLKNPNILALIAKKCPEAFGTLIVSA